MEPSDADHTTPVTDYLRVQINEDKTMSVKFQKASKDESGTVTHEEKVISTPGKFIMSSSKAQSELSGIDLAILRSNT